MSDAAPRIDHASPTWAGVVHVCEQEIDRLRDALEGGHGEIGTATIRGRIAALRWLIARPTDGDPEALARLFVPDDFDHV